MKTKEEIKALLLKEFKHISCDNCHYFNNSAFCERCHKEYADWELSENRADDLAYIILHG